MSGGDIVMLSMKELRRLPVIHQVMEMRVTQVEAGRVLGLTARQIRRIIKRFRKEGEKAVAHCGRGRSSNRRILEETKSLSVNNSHLSKSYNRSCQVQKGFISIIPLFITD